MCGKYFQQITVNPLGFRGIEGVILNLAANELAGIV